jgi:hypothetical protein
MAGCGRVPQVGVRSVDANLGEASRRWKSCKKRKLTKVL